MISFPNLKEFNLFKVAVQFFYDKVKASAQFLESKPPVFFKRFKCRTTVFFTIAPFSDLFFQTHIFSTYFTVPSSPPISVGISVINSTALIISWDYVPEADKNGIIINYKINVSLGLLSTLTDSFLITISDGLARDAVISNLTKWSYYTMKIAASTIKGTSNYSSNVTIRTAQDSKYIEKGLST